MGGDKLLRNDNNHFTDVSEEAGIYGSVIGFGLGVTIGDLNKEGVMHKPKVFVTRLIPAAGLEPVREYCYADVWTEPLPPSADTLRRKVSECEGLLSLLTERRRHAPRGARGGADGSPGRNTRNGEALPAKATVDLEAGDVVSIETPGGGGYGSAG